MSFDRNEHERLCEASFQTRDAAWAHWGEVDPHVLAPLINPAFMDAPPWPGFRQAYKVIRGSAGVVLASDGLSDPFDDSWEEPPRQNGFGMEVYGITEQAPEPASSWLFQVVAGFATQVAGHREVDLLLEERGTVSSELWDVPIPDAYREKFVTPEGRVGILVGLDAPPAPATIEGPLSPIRLANLKLLTLPELRHIVEHGDEGRRELARRLLATPAPLVSSLDRESVF